MGGCLRVAYRIKYNDEVQGSFLVRDSPKKSLKFLMEL
jgi:hypothetical protein